MATGKESFHARSVPAVPWGRILTLMLCLAVLALATWEYRMRQIGLQADDIGDGRGHWSVERRKLADSGPDAIAIVGAESAVC